MRNRWMLVAAAVLVPGLAPAQTPLKLSFGDAVKMATGQAAPVQLSALETDAARARVRQSRSALLPDVTFGSSWVNRDFNIKSFGIPLNFPGLGAVVPSFNNYDARLTLNQTLLDFSSIKRVRASEAQVQTTLAAGDATTESAAQAAALAYLRAARAQASVLARQADSAIAAEVLSLAQAQLQAGVSGRSISPAPRPRWRSPPGPSSWPGISTTRPASPSPVPWESIPCSRSSRSTTR